MAFLARRVVLALCLLGVTDAVLASTSRLEAGLQAYDRGELKTAFSILEDLALDADSEALAVAGYMLEKGQGTDKDPEEAMRFYKAGAIRDHPRCQALLGQAYETGLVGPPDLVLALQWYERAVEAGDNAARIRLARMYLEGRGVRADRGRGLDLLREGAENGNLNSQVTLAEVVEQLREQGREDELVRWFERDAEAGDANAQAQLAYMYQTGRGIPPDSAKAYHWALQAALQDHPNAEARLGYLYQTGTGIEQDFGEALAWYEKAAEKEEAVALNNLGYMHLKGLGVTPDSQRAAKYYARAARQGNAFAQANLGNLYWSGQHQQDDSEDSVNTALRWFRRAAEEGLAHARTSLGYAYQTGRGVTRDYAAAARWYSMASAQGDAVAQGNLAYLYQNGLGVESDAGRALSLFRAAAAGGYGYAQRNLGRAYQYGMGVPRDLEAAINWYDRASANGDPGAHDLALKAREELADTPSR